MEIGRTQLHSIPIEKAVPGHEQSLQMALRILRGATAANASDIHLRANSAPRVRIEGQLCPLDHPPLTEELVETAIAALATVSRVDPAILQRKQTDFSCNVKDVGRFRVHVYRQRGTRAAALRRIPNPIPDFASLRLPRVAKQVSLLERGLVLVTGATGNGKSTTIASMLSYANKKVSRHVVTIEDPVEFVFEDDRCTFSQREIGRDVDSMEEALDGVLREDPDMLFIGELRNLRDFDVALNAAESGRMVVSTFHSRNALQTIQRMINLYPPEHQENARARIAESIGAVICQNLVPRKNARQNVLVSEVLTRTPTVLECIRDANRLRGLTAALEAGTHEYGCHSFDQVLTSMVRDDLVTMDTAKAAAHSANDFVRNLNLMR